MCYSATTHSAGQPVVAGWNFQWIAPFFCRKEGAKLAQLMAEEPARFAGPV